MGHLKIESTINLTRLIEAFKKYQRKNIFDYCVIDNFFVKDIASKLENEFPDFNDKIWHEYNSPIEIKKTLNDWNKFPETTYAIFNMLNSNKFSSIIGKYSKITSLVSDNGLNGGGWHIHKKGGKLNLHLDYNIHPKLKLQRKLNIIIYLNSEWKSNWGGELGFFSNESPDKPGKLIKKITPKYNRAVIFDTSQNSWHGLVGKVTCPSKQFRKSIAAYYLMTPKNLRNKRGKALFAPTSGQEKNKKILDLIKKRSSVIEAGSVWNKIKK